MAGGITPQKRVKDESGARPPVIHFRRCSPKRLSRAALATIFTLCSLLSSSRAWACETADEEARGTSDQEVVHRLQQLVEGVLPQAAGTRLRQFAGHYSADTEQLAELIGGGFLAGSDLYLFLDGRFLYAEWADVEPETIYGQGRWSLSEGLIALALDSPIPDAARHRDCRYVPFQFSAGKVSSFRLVGVEWPLIRSIEKFDGPNRQLGLLINSLEQVERYTTGRRSREVYEEISARARRQRVTSVPGGRDGRSGARSSSAAP